MTKVSCDKIADMGSLKEERFILIHGLRSESSAAGTVSVSLR